MVVYFKKYTIFIAIIAVALPVIVSTIWPLLTGQIMAASISGLAALFVLFIGGLLIGYAIFERKAEHQADMYIANYNENCDPEAFVSEGADIARQISFPCNQVASWYMGYYAQALLDLGRVDEAKAIESGLQQSIDASKKPSEKAGIAANLLPVMEKIEGPQESLNLVEQALEYCKDAKKDSAQITEFLEIQKAILNADVSKDNQQIIKTSEKIRSSAAYPMRIRVEYAWDEASALYRTGDVSEEKRCLEFVVSHGGKLALASKAKARLANIA